MAEEKTEKPTQRRLNKARDEGNFPTAKTFVGALQFLAFVALLRASGPGWIRELQSGFVHLIATSLNPRLNASDLTLVCLGLMKQSMVPVGMLGLLMIGITIAVQLVVTGFGVSLKKMTPDWKRLDPLARLRQLPKQNLPALVQAALMIPIFGAAVYYLVMDNLTAFLALPLAGLISGVSMIGVSILALLWKAAGLFLMFGVVDLVRQKKPLSERTQDE